MRLAGRGAFFPIFDKINLKLLMKSLYLATALMAAFSLNAQTLTQANHAPAPGDIHNTFQCDSLGILPGASGAGATWNYSTVVTHSSIAKVYTVNAYSAASFSPANVAKFSSGTDNAYYRTTSSDLVYFGGSISVSTVVTTANYANPAIRGAYPMSLNTTSTSPISGTLNLTQPFPVTATFNGSSKVIADGTGTLILPGGAGGTFTNAIRVVSSQTLNFSVAIPPTTGTLTEVIYDYFSVGVKAPLFSIKSSTVVNSAIGTVTGSVVTINQNYLSPPTVTTSLSDNSAVNAQVNVFPNPSSSYVAITVENAAAETVDIYDITGKVVEKISFSDNKAKLDVSAYNNGLYIYKVNGASGNNLKTGKITVNH